MFPFFMIGYLGALCILRNRGEKRREKTEGIVDR
jgi:hypothetical protein